MENIDIVWGLVILFFGIILFVFFGQTLTKIIKSALYGIFYIGVGAFGLFLFNLLLQTFSQHIPINLITSLIAGILGVPGILALIIMKIFIIV